jgi:hypothetical protein
VEIKALKSEIFALLRHIGKNTGAEKMPKSVPYHPLKIKSLKDPNFSSAYLTEIFEEEEGDLELKIMRKALRDVFEALGEPNMSAGDGIATIYALASWLKALGLKLTVAVDAGDEEISANVAELAEVGKI